MVEQQPSKLMTRVRFPSPAPVISMGYDKIIFPELQRENHGKITDAASSQAYVQ
jgi:hypothetical protein